VHLIAEAGKETPKRRDNREAFLKTRVKESWIDEFDVAKEHSFAVVRRKKAVIFKDVHDCIKKDSLARRIEVILYATGADRRGKPQPQCNGRWKVCSFEQLFNRPIFCGWAIPRWSALHNSSFSLLRYHPEVGFDEEISRCSCYKTGDHLPPCNEGLCVLHGRGLVLQDFIFFG